MRSKLNQKLTYPMLVIAGAWNPGIFRAEWCAKHLFDVPDGENVRTSSVLSGPPHKETIYFGQVGISVSNLRLEIFSNGMDDGNLSEAETVAIRLLEKLPHTPIGALGVNFLFSVDDPDPVLIDSFNINDTMNEKYIVETSEIKTSIKVGSSVLNFSRGLLVNEVSFQFNYHYESSAIVKSDFTFDGIIVDRYKHAVKLLNDVFNLSKIEKYEKHNFPSS